MGGGAGFVSIVGGPEFPAQGGNGVVSEDVAIGEPVPPRLERDAMAEQARVSWALDLLDRTLHADPMDGKLFIRSASARTTTWHDEQQAHRSSRPFLHDAQLDQQATFACVTWHYALERVGVHVWWELPFV